MKGSILRKLRKCNVLDLLSWVSLCQLAPVNKDKMAYIEYAIGVLSTLTYKIKEKNREVNAILINQVFNNVFLDFEVVREESSSMLQSSFTLAHLALRGDGYPWQYADVAMSRYMPHKKWMLNNLGFTIKDAVDISKMIANQITIKRLNSDIDVSETFEKENFYKPKYIYVPDKTFVNEWRKCISFNKYELKSIGSHIDKDIFKNFFNRMSIDINVPHNILQSPVEFNILYEKPIIKMHDEYIFPIPSLLWRSISTTFHYDFLGDNKYIGKYMNDKGIHAENVVYKIFNKLYDETQIKTRVKYGKKMGEPDVDLIINDENFTYFIECSSKWITMDAKKGNIDAIYKDIKESILKCNNQLNRAYEYHINNDLVDNEIIPLIILDDFISYLDLILKEIKIPIKHLNPYIINIYDFDILTDLMNKQELKIFIEERRNLLNKEVIFCCDEIDYFVMFKKYGLDKYANEFINKGSMLFYIGHLEELYPSYYYDKFVPFHNDVDLVNLMRRKNIKIIKGWG